MTVDGRSKPNKPGLFLHFAKLARKLRCSAFLSALNVGHRGVLVEFSRGAYDVPGSLGAFLTISVVLIVLKTVMTVTMITETKNSGGNNINNQKEIPQLFHSC
jgi:hypothetical protein